MTTVAVVEDDAALRSVIERSFRSVGHRVVISRTAAEAMRDLPRAEPDVIVLDIGLPDADGRDVCLALKAAGLRAPVLMLTARDGLHDKVAGFESGADDYLTKPFELPELLVRVRALARRPTPPREQDGLHLDPARHAAVLGEHTVTLTPTEFRLLAKLLAGHGDVVRRQALVAAGWPMGAIVHENTLDTYVSRVRAKLNRLGDCPVAVETVRGVGYACR